MRLFIGLLVAFVGFGALGGFKLAWDTINNLTSATVCLTTLEEVGLASFGILGLVLVFAAIYKTILDRSGSED